MIVLACDGVAETRGRARVVTGTTTGSSPHFRGRTVRRRGDGLGKWPVKTLIVVKLVQQQPVA